MTDVAPPKGDPWRRAQDLVDAAGQDDRDSPDHSKPKPGKRVRIVLAERRTARRVVRTLADVEEQTNVGEVLVRQLMSAQLMLALRLGLLTVLVLGGLPLAFALSPGMGTFDLFGIRLPWLLLGVAIYPFFLAVAWSFNRSAERNEQDFSEIVES